MTVADTAAARPGPARRPPPPAAPDLSGLQKAAVLLVMLGKERAANVIKHLEGTDLDELVAQVVRLRNVSPNVAGEVLTQFHSLAVRQGVVGAGGEGYAREVLERSLGKAGRRRRHEAHRHRGRRAAAEVPPGRRPAAADVDPARRAPADHRRGARPPAPRPGLRRHGRARPPTRSRSPAGSRPPGGSSPTRSWSSRSCSRPGRPRCCRRAAATPSPAALQ